MTAAITLKKTSGDMEVITNILSFIFSKEIYTPYTRISAVFEAGKVMPSVASEICLYIDGKPIHHGYADIYRVTEENGIKKGYVVSRGFTSLLLQNQIEPGMYMNISIDSLMSNYANIPYVIHEQSSNTSYIFVKSGSSMWDGIVNLSYKLYGKYPYIRNENRVMIHRAPNVQTFMYENGQLLSKGSELDTRTVASYWSMSDIIGAYGSFTYTESEARDRNIIRERYFELDKRFLNDPQIAVEYRDKAAMRGWKKKFLTYSGYRGEDLFDYAVTDETKNDITSIKITGNEKGVMTEIGMYSDKFVPMR